MMHKYLSAILLCCLLTSCESPYYSQNQNIGADYWFYDNALDYSFEITDTNQLYQLDLFVEHHPEFYFENLYFDADAMWFLRCSCWLLRWVRSCRV